MFHLVYFEYDFCNYLAVVNYITDRYIIIGHDLTDDVISAEVSRFADYNKNIGIDFYLSLVVCEDYGYWENSLKPNVFNIKVLY